MENLVRKIWILTGTIITSWHSSIILIDKKEFIST